MTADLELKINRIIDSRDDTPLIFKAVLKKELALVQQEEIIEIVSIKREYTDNAKRKDIYSKAQLLVATNYGLVAVDDGLNDQLLEYGGYRIRHVMYSQIKALDFNTCLLSGTLKIITGTGGETDLNIEFNTSKYYRDIEKFVSIIRDRMIENERRTLN